MKNWLLLHSKPHKEDFLWSEIQARKIDCFYPKIWVQTNNPRIKKTRPYFPGYLFVKIEPGSQEVNELKWFPGVVSWVYFGGDPASVPESVINGIRRHVDSLNTTGRNAFNNIKKGTPIQVIEGPFAGYDGVFETRLSSSERVSVLLRLVHSQQKRVEMPSGLVRIKN